MEPKHLIHKKGRYISKLRKARIHHKVIFYLVGGLGIVLVWKGLSDFLSIQPLANHPIELIILGVVLSAISGRFFKVF